MRPTTACFEAVYAAPEVAPRSAASDTTLTIVPPPAAAIRGRVAEEAGISRRSLFRYFPAKGDLVWHGSAPVEARLHGILAALPVGTLTYVVLTDVVVDSLHAFDHRERGDPHPTSSHRRQCGSSRSGPD
ncbi:TetR family transcriptional regulator [Mycetocola saprophilus]|uniref:TetR family transcriptional regulator n=1 Tax=Mycetocola saprophilus TaxID=76636 RepID=UPI003BF2A72C